VLAFLKKLEERSNYRKRCIFSWTRRPKKEMQIITKKSSRVANKAAMAFVDKNN